MGRQTEIYMLREDARIFLDYVQKHDPVMITLRSSDSPEVLELPEPTSETQDMTLWNKNLLPSLKRKFVSHPGREYYRVDDSLPTLEYSPSTACEWNGRAALLRGRIYGFFDKPTRDYERWYNLLVRWIRRTFVKNPIKSLRGYVGPAAFKWFQEGGILLPMFKPPVTPQWLSFVEAQHPGSDDSDADGSLSHS